MVFKALALIAITAFAIQFAEGAIQYLKISQPRAHLHLREVQAFAIVNGVEKNVALSSYGATATQSSVYNNNLYAGLAIDGNITEQYSETAVGDFAPWWEVDLKVSYEVTKVIFWLRTDCCDYRMSGSKVYLMNSNRSTEKEFTLGDTTGKASIELLGDIGSVGIPGSTMQLSSGNLLITGSGEGERAYCSIFQ
jgi:hypothetical protein